MMSLFVFLVLLLGIFGVFITQYLGQYREAYKLWIQYVVYDKDMNLSREIKKDVGSQIESYSRELCSLSHILSIIYYAICLTFMVICVVMALNWEVVNRETTEYYIYLGSGIMTLVSFLGLPMLLHYSNINILSPGKTSEIDKDLFEVWYNLQCHGCKQEIYKKKLEPCRLYEIWAEKINNGELDCSSEEREYLNHLLHDNDINSKP